MKKSLTSTALALLIVTGGYAQSAQIKIRIKENEVPAVVVQSFKQNFKDDHSEGWAIVPVAILDDEYIVSEHNNLIGEKPIFYVVKIKGQQVRGEAVYDHDGSLKYSKEVIKDTALPMAVRDAIAKKYPGYTFLKDQETVKDGKFKFIHYRVLIENDKEKIALAVDSSGEILREKRVRSI
ncbi:MAG: hypothetical protein KF860_08940 [Cyclobacteriaceae bacterium]|nr:hypothetical protein [Cyclobacteriaceae bacterium]